MKRQRNRRGFTLAETLAALVIVVLLAMSVQMGTMTALRARTVSRFQSESEILAATLNSALGDMLHYATCAKYIATSGLVYINNPGYVIHGPEQAEKEIQFAFRAINEIPSAGARG